MLASSNFNQPINQCHSGPLPDYIHTTFLYCTLATVPHCGNNYDCQPVPLRTLITCQFFFSLHYCCLVQSGFVTTLIQIAEIWTAVAVRAITGQQLVSMWMMPYTRTHVVAHNCDCTYSTPDNCRPIVSVSVNGFAWQFGRFAQLLYVNGFRCYGEYWRSQHNYTNDGRWSVRAQVVVGCAGVAACRALVHFGEIQTAVAFVENALWK